MGKIMNKNLPSSYYRSGDESGIVLISTILLLGMFVALFGAYQASTQLDTATTRYSKDTTTGFYSAEAGLNLRAETIRGIFVGFNRPSGSSPNTTNACSGGNLGSGDYGCRSTTMNNRSIRSYVVEDPANPLLLTIPRGERYENLTAQEYRYTARSNAIDSRGDTEAQLELRFKTRLVPLFQFAAFYNKDLEILPGPLMTLSGPVHTNGSLYVYSDGSRLDISGQVTAAGSLYRGRKDGSRGAATCSNSQVRVMDPGAFRALIPTCPSRTLVTNTDIAPFNGMIQHNVQTLTVPGPEVFNAAPGAVYWDRADLRLVLVLGGAAGAETITGVQVRTAANTLDAVGTNFLTSTCSGSIGLRPVGGTTSMYNFREQRTIRMLEVDMQNLLNCLRSSSWFGTGKSLADDTDGGLVFHLSVSGPASETTNGYGVRIRNAASLQASTAGSPLVKGMTIVTDQAGYIFGHFNSNNKIPAAVMADSINIISPNWSDANSANSNVNSRIATATTVNTAFLAGTDSTGGPVGAATSVAGVEGTGGQGGNYNGGLENYPRFHENWSGRTLLYRGSFVSLDRPRKVIGSWAWQSYGAPNRDWNYDVSFNDAANLPPITPRFVYLRQELFVRDFDQRN